MVRRGRRFESVRGLYKTRKCLQIGSFCCQSQHRGAPPSSAGAKCRARGASAKCLQIAMLPATTEHLLRSEGLARRVARNGPREPLGQPLRGPGSRLSSVWRSLWDRFWGRPTKVGGERGPRRPFRRREPTPNTAPRRPPDAARRRWLWLLGLCLIVRKGGAVLHVGQRLGDFVRVDSGDELGQLV
jgi:hypothetical protein